MLKIHFGEINTENYIFNPDVYFNNTYEDEWLSDSFTIDMVKDIDGSDVKGPRLIDSPFLGPIPPERLSGGVKTLILIKNDSEHIFNASSCGDNCAKWLLKIGEEKNITINLRHLMDFGDNGYKIHIMNDDIIATNRRELVMAAGKYV